MMGNRWSRWRVVEEAQASKSGSIKLGYTIPVQDRTENPGIVVEYVN